VFGGGWGREGERVVRMSGVGGGVCECVCARGALGVVQECQSCGGRCVCVCVIYVREREREREREYTYMHHIYPLFPNPEP
jgi:hypothetical protein